MYKMAIDVLRSKSHLVVRVKTFSDTSDTAARKSPPDRQRDMQQPEQTMHLCREERVKKFERRIKSSAVPKILSYSLNGKNWARKTVITQRSFTPSY